MYGRDVMKNPWDEHPIFGPFGNPLWVDMWHDMDDALGDFADWDDQLYNQWFWMDPHPEHHDYQDSEW